MSAWIAVTVPGFSSEDLNVEKAKMLTLNEAALGCKTRAKVGVRQMVCCHLSDAPSSATCTVSDHCTDRPGARGLGVQS